MAADNLAHDLLSGLLALTNKLATQDELLDTVRMCMGGGDLAVDEALLLRRIISDEEHQVLKDLTTIHLRRSQGRVERALAALHLDPQVRRELSALGVNADLFSECASRPPLSSVASVTSPGPEQQTTGTERFRILHLHARGGLGEVMLAADAEFKRRVALKQMRSELAHDIASRSRFLFEAHITAMLEHSGVVPVYALGRYADGRPFYAMRFVHGETMKDALVRFHAPGRESNSRNLSARNLEFRELLARFIAVCEVIQFAHDKHVLHRDIKPGNIMLGEYGETLVVDWGLAKITHRAETAAEAEAASIPETSHVTLQGRRLGTPGYMSPEQEAGDLDLLGPPADIYSLGATLLNLLTGSRPGHAPQHENTVRDTRHEQTVVSSRAGGVSIPAPLRAVCAKAMQAKPEERYCSAQGMADDVRRWLADEPVAAWKEPLRLRVARMVRKHPGVVGGVILSVLAIALALVAIARNQAASNRRDREAAIARLMQRGDFASAEQYLNALVQSDRNPSIAMRLQRLQTLDALLRPAELRRELDALQQSPGIENVALFQLWQGDIVILESLAAKEAIHRAIALGLPKDEEFYARSLLSESTAEMIQWLEQALKENLFHVRALRQLILTLTFSARHDEAERWLQLARRVFPDDPTFTLLEATVAMLAGRSDATTILSGFTDVMSPRDHRLLYELWSEIEAMRKVNPVATQAAADGQRIVNRIRERFREIQSAGRQSRDVLSTLRAIPPCFAAYHVLLDEGGPSLERLEHAARIHPDGFFHYLIGEKLKRQTPVDLKAVEAAFERAAELSSLRPDAPARATFQLAMTRFQLFQHSGDATTLQQAVVNLRRRLAMQPPMDPQEASRAVEFLTHAGEFDLARSLVQQQLQTGSEDRLEWLPQLCQLEMYAENYLQALRIASGALQENADLEWARTIREQARRQLRLVAAEL